MSALDSKLRSQLDTVCQKAPRGLKRRRGPPCRSGPSMPPNRTRISRPPSRAAQPLACPRSPGGRCPAGRQAPGHRRRLFRRSTPLPVVAAKGSFGNLRGSGMIEPIASLPAMRHGRLFPILDYSMPDLACPVSAVRDGGVPPGASRESAACARPR